MSHRQNRQKTFGWRAGFNSPVLHNAGLQRYGAVLALDRALANLKTAFREMDRAAVRDLSAALTPNTDKENN